MKLAASIKATTANLAAKAATKARVQHSVKVLKKTDTAARKKEVDSLKKKINLRKQTAELKKKISKNKIRIA
jgi:hypothetical protein